MSIDKESNGVPEVDFRRKTTKVNLWIIIAIGLFYIGAGVAIYWFKKHQGS